VREEGGQWRGLRRAKRGRRLPKCANAPTASEGRRIVLVPHGSGYGSYPPPPFSTPSLKFLPPTLLTHLASLSLALALALLLLSLA